MLKSCKRWFGVGIVVVALSGAFAPSAYAERGEVTVEERYELGLKYMKRGYYVKAMEEFNRIRNYHRDDPYAVKAELAIADLHFKKTEWDQARIAYQDFLNLHPRHEDIDYVVYRLGMTSFKKASRVAARDQTWTRQAVNTWTGFDTRFAESEHLVEVEEKLGVARDRLAHKEFLIARFYFRRGAWSAVVDRSEGLLRTYPTGTDVPRTLALVAVAYAERGQPELAIEAVRRLNEDFPDNGAVRLVQRKHPELFEGLPEAAPVATE